MSVEPKDVPLQTLATVLAPDQFMSNPVDLLAYDGDAGLDKAIPDGVVFPRTPEDIVRIVQWANTHQVPLIARGAGTGLSGGAVAEHGGLIVSFSRMDQILNFDVTGRSIVAQPGVITLTLEELVRTKDLYYPPDPSSGRASTLGGNLAENSGGPHCFKYGVTTNYVTGLEVVLADGAQVRFGGDALDYPEYDIVGLLIGSEGTLGLITAAYLRLIRNPPAVQTLMAAFDSVEQAGRAVSAIIAHGLVPATLEMMDQKIMGIIEDFAHPGLPIHAGAALIIEADGYARVSCPRLKNSRRSCERMRRTVCALPRLPQSGQKSGMRARAPLALWPAWLLPFTWWMARCPAANWLRPWPRQTAFVTPITCVWAMSFTLVTVICTR